MCRDRRTVRVTPSLLLAMLAALALTTAHEQPEALHEPELFHSPPGQGMRTRCRGCVSIITHMPCVFVTLTAMPTQIHYITCRSWQATPPVSSGLYGMSTDNVLH